MFNNNITLINGRHKVVMNGDQPLLSDGDLLVQDLQDNNIFTMSLCPNTLQFFNLEYSTHDSTDQSAVCNYGGSSDGCLNIEQRESTVSSTASWKDDNEVKCLISLWQDHQKHFKTMKSRDVWASISEALKKTTPEWKKKTSIQCENKWKDIKRKYMEIKDHNNQSGNDPKTCKFYEELEEVLGEKPCVKPIAVASNLKKRKVSLNEDSDFEEMHENSGSSIPSEKLSIQRKRKMTRVQRELKDWSTALLTDAKAREEAKERRHKEAIAESKAAVNAYKEVMEKLINKL